ncbi:zinc-binding dehydrogenase [Blastococcus sp. MG754426]|uniref:alcohol dehydrogenase catalytic domain-containing protein n=1 Tax=unclassified Blastococcus TaxID=2619396 RepID=UPI001EF023D7|nr:MULTISPECIES: alcohol dehydrogenase catalytic domain-containing protein [unclassified Blastococcus]MCF6507879.1 zinc-binding dehydrogenase [Blastococcus sp. MG754426]MCF6512419.1 zinc-binding dehydrogenase [Blastococcus sp. MG754427]MCF6735215.1 zinc-binding dehydrogenase [Blastococcus sp. KM273129]
MRAVRFHEVGRPPRVEELDPLRPGPGEVLIDVAAAGVCGTELHFLDGLLTPARTPITLGHEVAGVVAEVGEGVSDVAAGGRVAVHYLHACGRCRWCRSGDDHLCDAPLGFLAFATDGGFAEQVVVPASAVVPVPPEVDLSTAAVLCCSATTALHAVEVAGVRPGDTAVVYGVGGVGLALVQVLRERGARPIAVARNADRLALARELGAEVTVDAGVEDVVAAVRAATGGAGADVVVELVGTRETSANALASLGKQGRLVYVGYSFDRIGLDPLSLVVPEQRILTSVGNRRSELVAALDLAARGRLRTTVTEHPLADAPRVLEDLRAGRVVGRAVLVP